MAGSDLSGNVCSNCQQAKLLNWHAPDALHEKTNAVEDAMKRRSADISCLVGCYSFPSPSRGQICPNAAAAHCLDAGLQSHHMRYDLGAGSLGQAAT